MFIPFPTEWPPFQQFSLSFWELFANGLAAKHLEPLTRQNAPEWLTSLLRDLMTKSSSSPSAQF